VIIISHSLSQIIDADYTYVMKEGTIAEHGEHDQLYHQQGVYKEIFDAMAKSLNIEKLPKLLKMMLRKKLIVSFSIPIKNLRAGGFLFKSGTFNAELSVQFLQRWYDAHQNL